MSAASSATRRRPGWYVCGKPTFRPEALLSEKPGRDVVGDYREVCVMMGRNGWKQWRRFREYTNGRWTTFKVIDSTPIEHPSETNTRGGRVRETGNHGTRNRHVRCRRRASDIGRDAG